MHGFAIVSTVGGDILFGENVAQNKVVYPNVTYTVGSPENWLDLSYENISWSINNRSQPEVSYNNQVFNYKTIMDAIYLIPYNADNVKLSLTAFTRTAAGEIESKTINRTESVSNGIFDPSGSLKISGINAINSDKHIIVKPNVNSIISNPKTGEISYNQIKWTIKGTDISFIDNTINFTQENIVNWKKKITDNSNPDHSKSLINGIPQLRLSLNAGNSTNRISNFQTVYGTQFAEISGNVYEGDTIIPNILYADDFSFTNITYESYNYDGSLNKNISAHKFYNNTVYNKNTIKDASFTIPNAAIFGDEDKWELDKRPTVKLSIQIFNNTGFTRTFTITSNILFNWDTTVTSKNSYLDISGVIELDNITQKYIILKSNFSNSATNLGSLLPVNVFEGSPPTTLLEKCLINYSEFIKWGAVPPDNSFTQPNKDSIIENIGNTHHFNFSYEKNKSTILSLSFEHLFNGNNKFRNKKTTRVKNIQYTYLLDNNETDISHSYYPGVYSQENIHNAFLDVSNIELNDEDKNNGRLKISYDIYEFNPKNKTRIEHSYYYNLKSFQNDESTLTSLYVLDNIIAKPTGYIRFGSKEKIGGKVLWPSNYIYPDIVNIEAEPAKNDHLYFDNVKYTLTNLTSNSSHTISCGNKYYTKDNIQSMSFELFDNLAKSQNNSYRLRLDLTAYDLAGKDVGYDTHNAFTAITRGSNVNTLKFERTDFSYSQDFSASFPFDGRVTANNSSIYEIKPNDNIYPDVSNLYFGRYRGDNSRITYDNVQWMFLYDNNSKKYTDTWWGNGTIYAEGNVNADNGYDLSKTELWNLKHTDPRYGNWGYWMNYSDNIYNYENIKNAYFKVPIDSVGTLQLSMRLRYNNGNDFSQNVLVPKDNMFSRFIINSMSAGGDPMIMTINGDMYKMSNFNGFSRMLQGMIHNKPIFINVETSESTKEECLEAASWVKNELKDDVEFNNVSEETYLDYDEAFMRKLWLSYNGQEILIDMDKQRILNNTFDGVKFCANDDKHIFPFYKNQEIPETIEIHLPNLGKLFVGYYDNPQIRTCFHFESETDIINAGGAIVHCLNAESIQIPSLTSTEFIHARANDECKYVIQYAVVTTNGENENEKEITNINCY